MEFQEILVKELVEKQAEAGLAGNDTAFARKLQLRRTTWVHVKALERVAGLEVLSRVVKLYPELSATVVSYLQAYPGRAGV